MASEAVTREGDAAGLVAGDLAIWLRLSSTPSIPGDAALPSFVSAVREIGRFDPALSLVVWTLKREVRAIRGCLGAYRR